MNEAHIGRPVLFRTKHDVFRGKITGDWYDKSDGSHGPMVSTQDNVSFAVDWKRIIRFTDTDEIPWTT